jgi:16S rRNA (adenine1518-N6/adenine1519-N6)-dimethyltransferase
MRREASSGFGTAGILRRYGLRPRKELGQHFLTDERIANRITALAELTSADTVIEVGAGLGALTRPLARTAGQVLAVELDRDLASALSQLLAREHNVTLVQGDILRFSSAELLTRAGLVPGTPYVVVGNLPYVATSAILRHFLEMDPHPLRVVVTVQREVAERITARPGEMSLLSVSVQFYGRPKIVLRLTPRAFYPRPGVSSAVVRIDCYDESPLSVEDSTLFFRVARAGFTQRRKQLHNSLTSGLALPGDEVRDALQRTGIDPRRRAQTLSLGEWAALCRVLSPLISLT